MISGTPRPRLWILLSLALAGAAFLALRTGRLGAQNATAPEQAAPGYTSAPTATAKACCDKPPGRGALLLNSAPAPAPSPAAPPETPAPAP